MTPPISKPGPDKTDISLDQVETLAAIGCTLDEIAAVVGLSARTLQRRENEDADFLASLERGRAKGRASLRRLQWEAAKGRPAGKAGPAIAPNITAQIWLGKQLLGQRSFEREEKNIDPVAPPPLIIQLYSDEPVNADSTQQATDANLQVPGALPRSGGGT